MIKQIRLSAQARDQLIRSMDVLDFADPNRTVGRREESNTPDQGLYFLNNEFVVKQSESLARRLVDASDKTEKQIELAFLWAYGREATDKELSAARQFYQSFDVSDSKSRRGNSRAAVELKKLSALCQGIFASAEFRFLN